MGMTPVRAVVYATGLAFILSFLDRSSLVTPKRIWDALALGAMGALSVIPVTGGRRPDRRHHDTHRPGPKLANIIVETSPGGTLPLTA